MRPKKIFILVIILAFALAAGAYYFIKFGRLKAINSFDECAKSGYPVSLSYPAVCRTPDGRTFRQEISSYSQECGVCGLKGLHNVEGKTCAPGLECKNSDGGMVSSVSFCVKPGESIEKCL